MEKNLTEADRKTLSDLIDQYHDLDGGGASHDDHPDHQQREDVLNRIQALVSPGTELIPGDELVEQAETLIGRPYGIILPADDD